MNTKEKVATRGNVLMMMYNARSYIPTSNSSTTPSQDTIPEYTPTYVRIIENRGDCSATCGGGTQMRTVYCKSSGGGQVAESYCNGAKPVTSQTCNTAVCDTNTYSWYTSNYSTCSATTPTVGSRSSCSATGATLGSWSSCSETGATLGSWSNCSVTTPTVGSR